MAKRGRPSTGIKTELVHLRLPVAILKRMRGSPRGLTGEIKDRLARSVAIDAYPPTRDLAEAVQWIADEVSRHAGAKWNDSAGGRGAVVAGLKAWIEATVGSLEWRGAADDLFWGADDPAIVGRTIARSHRLAKEAEALERYRSTRQTPRGDK